VASFAGGRTTSDASALLLGTTDRVIGLTRRLATYFIDSCELNHFTIPLQEKSELLNRHRQVGGLPGRTESGSRAG
jgi:hypothetical protein